MTLCFDGFPVVLFSSSLSFFLFSPPSLVRHHVMGAGGDTRSEASGDPSVFNKGVL